MGNSSKCEKLPTLSISYFSNSKINDFQKKNMCISVDTEFLNARRHCWREEEGFCIEKKDSFKH